MNSQIVVRCIMVEVPGMRPPSVIKPELGEEGLEVEEEGQVGKQRQPGYRADRQECCDREGQPTAETQGFLRGGVFENLAVRVCNRRFAR